ncbi:hypothetical protein A1O3_05263 [Capronia epimyces CBS 606.96]|uniref:Uncharacterized protein n=1 Tax=Capronia epimyces CBS 606.96 TaxID=1182542 RepID=W9XWI2_9EURO|nr:uncharacterized protein A1O3_05263 [Capronia epimyces CBS 606.96]EXJ84593.1 hypothetical protein A1O3_05263 [Capronia epimyces CBS 606.96]
MECASRAIAFWTYQITQEISYQEYVARNLGEQNDHLNTAVDQIVHDANAEIQSLEKKLEGTSNSQQPATHSDLNGALTVDHKTLEHKYTELVDLYREKSRKHSQTQKLYDTLKRKCLADQSHGVVFNNDGQTLRSVNPLPQPAMARARTDLNEQSAQHQRFNERTDLRGGPLRQGPEQLHPHQRSGSSAYGGDQVGMPPPEKSRMTKPRMFLRAQHIMLLLTVRSKYLDPWHSSAQDSFT